MKLKENVRVIQEYLKFSQNLLRGKSPRLYAVKPNIHAKYNKNLQIFTEAYQGYILEMGKQKAIETSARNSYLPSIYFFQ
jgi:hypothetical protein